VDNDTWCITNAGENITENQCAAITLQLAETMPPGPFYVVLANINLHVLAAAMPVFSKAVVTNGWLLISGILETDVPQITALLAEAGFTPQPAIIRGKWACLSCRRDSNTDV
jgi:ribosomal protein L11 methyltransferase